MYAGALTLGGGSLSFVRSALSVGDGSSRGLVSLAHGSATRKARGASLTDALDA